MNLSLKHVQEVIARCPGVLAVAVRMMRQEEGHRLKAFVVGDVTEVQLREWSAKELASWEQPAKWNFGAELPRSGMGKDADW
jgi:acyl-coenzyme A synthetase/AMP-(fatty) acid ligase